eukprot:CAMPEP_0168747680 /NCGR_PEP_ID=MMETSP0724-20121128/15783_1 /TAXON_ID=265536 /ORGANISM="Amphiprora sp., Strain CCMP467" /LENGTH=322 /DNA_ID=CAMNT_0008795481 /DNA_START=422 /DNA_END=1390 /DNA_ORIENTATION=-
MTDDAVATQTNGDGTLDASAFTYDDPEAFASISHPGYTMDSDPETFLGGWLAHRKVLQEEVTDENGETTKHKDWIQDDGVAEMMTRYDYETMPIGRAPRLLVLYGSLRETSYSRKMAYEFARLLEVLGCDVRVYNPRGLPVRDPVLDKNVKVQELRALTQWSDGHVWVSPEMHGTVTGVFKNQIDWIPLNTGSVRPTQGKTCLVAQVNGGSQSFNAVNYLRLLARWMRMPCCTNQSSVAKAWKEFDDENGGRMKPSSFRDRVVDCAEEFAKFNALVRGPHADELTNRYSERKEKEEKGRLLTQAEKEAEKDKNATITNSRKA